MVGGSGLAGVHRFVGVSDGECHSDSCVDGEPWLCADCVVSEKREFAPLDVSTSIGTCQAYGSLSPRQGTLMTMAVGAFAVSFNVFATKHLPFFEGVILVMFLIGVLVVIIPLWALAPRASVGDVFGKFENFGGWSTMGGACIVGQMAASAAFIVSQPRGYYDALVSFADPRLDIQGVDSAVHMAEEVKDASRTVPRMGMYRRRLIKLDPWLTIPQYGNPSPDTQKPRVGRPLTLFPDDDLRPPQRPARPNHNHHLLLLHPIRPRPNNNVHSPVPLRRSLRNRNPQHPNCNRNDDPHRPHDARNVHKRDRRRLAASLVFCAGQRPPIPVVVHAPGAHEQRLDAAAVERDADVAVHPRRRGLAQFRRQRSVQQHHRPDDGGRGVDLCAEHWVCSLAAVVW